MPIPVIDLFAGPGGLGEGFSAARSATARRLFRVKLSIEKEDRAHRTLELRAFSRQFRGRSMPADYYEYLRGEIDRATLFRKHPRQAAAAQAEAWLAELGKEPNSEVDLRIIGALAGASKWVLIGGPPCQAYSLVGRSRMLGENAAKYEADPRHFLYKEYLRILAVHKPPVFVMENVKGLLSSRVNQQSTFGRILADLQDPLTGTAHDHSGALRYKLFSVSKPPGNDASRAQPGDYIVRCEDYGIPQARHRLIILGIRADLFKSAPGLLRPQGKTSIDEVIADLPRLRSGLSKETDSAPHWRDAIKSAVKAKWLSSVHRSLREKLRSAASNVAATLPRGESFVPFLLAPRKYQAWYVDGALAGVCNHESRAHIRSDLHRYLFAAVYAQVHGRSPTLTDFPPELLPEHDNVQEALHIPKFNDRFRVQLRGRPATTITSHISKDGHYYIHYDPSQCRSLTVREAARLQTFPDNYFFEGNRTEQYHQVGNAVPPLLALQIAGIVANVIRTSA